MGRFMEHGVGYFIEMPGQPSLFQAGDTHLTPQVRACVSQHQPNVCMVPAGGPPVTLVMAHHLEAISHCPLTRAELLVAGQRVGVSQRLLMPADGQTLEP